MAEREQRLQPAVRWHSALMALMALLASLCLFALTHATPAGAQPPAADITLRSAGYPDQTAQGLAPTINLFFPGPGDYALADQGNSLSIVFSHSPLLRDAVSTMTVLLNDSDLTAVALTAANAQMNVLQVTLPAGRVLPGVNKVTLKLYMRTREGCEDPSNPALFTRVQRESAIHYAYQEGFPLAAPSTNLALFPYPIVRAGYMRGGGTTFVLPEQPSQAELTAAATLAATISRLGAPPDWKPNVAAVTRLHAPDVDDNDLVVIGTPASNGLAQALAAGQQLGGGAGLVRLAASPFNAKRGALLVSGDSDEAILRAAFALADRRTRSGLSGATALVHDVEPALRPFPVESADLEIAFAKIGGGAITVTGTREPPQTLNFLAPPPSGADGKLRLWMSHSKVMQEDRSNLRLSFNGIALTSISLDSSNRDRTLVELPLPARALRPGLNQLQIEFNLHLPADGDSAAACLDPAMERAWVSIYPDSSIAIRGGALPAEPDVAYFPYPFLQTVGMSGSYIVAPPGVDALRPSLLIAASLGRRNTADSDAIGMSSAAQLTEAQRRDYELLAVGLPSNNPLIRDLGAALPLRFEDGSDRILSEGGANLAALRDTGDAGIFEVAASPFSDGRWVGVITGGSDTMLDLIRAALERPRESGTIVVARGPDDAIDVRLLPKAAQQAEQRTQRARQILPLLTAGVLTLAALLAGGWLVAVARSRSRRGAS